MIAIDSHTINNNEKATHRVEEEAEEEESFWVHELTEAIQKNDESKIKSIQKKHSRWFNKPLPQFKGQSMCSAIQNQNQNILHLIFQQCPNGNKWMKLRLFDSVFENDEDFMSLMFQEDANGFTPIHYALILASFQDAWLLVHSVLHRELHFDSNIQGSSLFDHELYGRLLRPFSSLSIHCDHSLTKSIIQRELNKKLNQCARDDMYLPMTRLLVNHFDACDINACTGDHYIKEQTPLHTAVEHKQVKTIEFLMNQKSVVVPNNLLCGIFAENDGAKWNETEQCAPWEKQRNVIESVIGQLKNDETKIRQLINYKDNPTKHSNDSIVAECARRGMLKTVELLIEKGADVGDRKTRSYQEVLAVCPSNEIRDQIKEKLDARQMFQNRPMRAKLPNND